MIPARRAVRAPLRPPRRPPRPPRTRWPGRRRPPRRGRAAAPGGQPSGGGERQPDGLPRARAGAAGTSRSWCPAAGAASTRRGPSCPQALDGMQDALRPTPVALRGRPQRHLYLTSCRALCARRASGRGVRRGRAVLVPGDAVGAHVHTAGMPFGVQCYENIDRELPPRCAGCARGCCATPPSSQRARRPRRGSPAAGARRARSTSRRPPSPRGSRVPARTSIPSPSATRDGSCRARA